MGSDISKLAVMASSGVKEYDGTIDIPGASMRPQAPGMYRGRAPILIRQGELRGGRRKRKVCGGSMALAYTQAGKGTGCHRGMLGKGKKQKGGKRSGKGGPPGAQDALSALRLNNQPVPSNSAEPVAYKGVR